VPTPPVKLVSTATLAPLLADLERWLREERRPKLSRGNDLARAMDYLLKRWPAFTRSATTGVFA
jgi:transposase